MTATAAERALTIARLECELEIGVTTHADVARLEAVAAVADVQWWQQRKEAQAARLGIHPSRVGVVAGRRR